MADKNLNFKRLLLLSDVVILIESVLKGDDAYYSQGFPEEKKFMIKKQVNYLKVQKRHV